MRQAPFTPFYPILLERGHCQDRRFPGDAISPPRAMSNGQTGHTALEAVHVCVLLRSVGPGLWSALPLKLEHAGREIPK